MKKVKRVVLGEGIPYWSIMTLAKDSNAYQVGLTVDGIKDFFEGEQTKQVFLNRVGIPKKDVRIRLIAEILEPAQKGNE